MNKNKHHLQFIVKHMPLDQHMHLPAPVYIADITITSQITESKKQKPYNPKTVETKATHAHILKNLEFLKLK